MRRYPTLEGMQANGVSVLQPAPAYTSIRMGACISAAAAAPQQTVAVGPIDILELIGGILLLLSDPHGVLIAWPDPSDPSCGGDALALRWIPTDT